MKLSAQWSLRVCVSNFNINHVLMAWASTRQCSLGIWTQTLLVVQKERNRTESKREGGKKLFGTCYASILVYVTIEIPLKCKSPCHQKCWNSVNEYTVHTGHYIKCMIHSANNERKRKRNEHICRDECNVFRSIFKCSLLIRRLCSTVEHTLWMFMVHYEEIPISVRWTQ